MKETADLRQFLMKEKHNVRARGHVRIDYTDPITGKVLERIEGDNHVFVNQLIAQDFQNTALASTLVLTNGTRELDTDIPILPGKPIGYGNINSAATGVYRGAYRNTDSFYNKITQSGITNLYVYDFLTTQITDVIRYVGLSAQAHVGTPSVPFQYRYPRADCSGIYDIERKKLFYGFTCSLSGEAGGKGSLYFYDIENEPSKTGVKRDVFELCDKPDNYYSSYYDRGYQATWGYDYENQTVALCLVRYRSTRTYRDGYYYYQWFYKEDWWVFNKDATEVLKHFTYTWNTEENTSYRSWQYGYNENREWWTGDKFPAYFRLYGDNAFTMSRATPTYGDTVYSNVFYVYKCDITSGGTSYEKYNTGHESTNGSTYLTGYTSTLYMFKGYTWGTAIYDSSYGMGYGLDGSTQVSVNPMFDVYTDDIYSLCPITCGNSYPYRYLIEKGQTSIYGTTWNMKYTDENDAKSRPTSPFAFTAYQLPADAPVRPKNSAVTIAYGLTVNW